MCLGIGVANFEFHAALMCDVSFFAGDQVLAMENLLRQLERQEGLMSHIQKALGEYLEGQRQVTVSFFHSFLFCLLMRLRCNSVVLQFLRT